jgi:hypothetical protein
MVTSSGYHSKAKKAITWFCSPVAGCPTSSAQSNAKRRSFIRQAVLPRQKVERFQRTRSSRMRTSKASCKENCGTRKGSKGLAWFEEMLVALESRSVECRYRCSPDSALHFVSDRDSGEPKSTLFLQLKNSPAVTIYLQPAKSIHVKSDIDAIPEKSQIVVTRRLAKTFQLIAVCC